MEKTFFITRENCWPIVMLCINSINAFTNNDYVLTNQAMRSVMRRKNVHVYSCIVLLYEQV
jgi:hypothetical protein